MPCSLHSFSRRKANWEENLIRKSLSVNQTIYCSYLHNIYFAKKITLKEPFAFQIKNLREASLLSCPENPITPF